jgi:hypothetical protein
LFACKNKKDAGAPVEIDGTITVSLDMNEEQSIDFTDMIDSVRFIRLETTDDCLIGKIQKVIFHDGLYYIQDTKASSVFVFDGTGKCKLQICKKGQGPGEYIHLKRLLLDYGKKQLLIYDDALRKMIYYTLDGKHIKDIPFGNNAIARDVALLPDGSFLCYTPDYQDGYGYWGVWKVDSTGKFNKYLWEYTIQYPAMAHEHSAYFHELQGNRTGLWCADNNDVFHFSNDTIYKYLSMKINMKTNTDYPGYGKWENLPYKNLMIKTNVTEKDNFILITWRNVAREYRASLYLKNERKTIVSQGGMSFGKDVIHGHDVPFNCTDQMMHVIDAEDVEYMLADDHTSDEHKAMLKSMFSEREEENPVLEILYLKK